MKIIIILIVGVLILGGCTSVTDPVIQNTNLNNEVNQNLNQDILDSMDMEKGEDYSKELDPENTDYSIYNQWAINWQDNVVMPHGYETTDCIGLANGVTFGGDLLSTLIVDPEFISYYHLKTNKYTPEYIQSLEKKVATYTQTNTKSDFYAFYVCHLADDLDLVAGYYWPTTQKFVWDYDLITEKNRKHLLLINNKKVTELAGVEVLDNTLTGGEVNPCRAQLIEENQIQWSCITAPGFEINEQGQTSGIHKTYWAFNMYGQLIETWQDIDKTNF